MPAEIRSGRTVVLVSAPAGTWQEVATHFHPMLASHGIDAIAYYQLEEVMAGPDAQKELLPLLERRRFEQVAVLEANTEGQGQLFICTFHNSPALVAIEGAVWHASFGHKEGLDAALQSAFAATSIASSNYLIPDFPDFFRAASVPRDKRFERINPDLKLDNLAVRSFTGILAADNSRLEQVMQGYPFKWEKVNPELSEDVMRRNGFQWILGYLRAPEANLKEILGYTLDGSESSRMVYKFYVRQLYAQEIYLGGTWDAHGNWEQALKSFIRQVESIR